MTWRRNRERRSSEVSHRAWRPALSTRALGAINGSGVRRLVVLVLLLWLLPSAATPATRPVSLARVAFTSSSAANAAGRLVIPARSPLQLAVGDGSLWVTTPRELIRVDPVSGRVVARIALPAIAGALVVAGHQVWVATNPIITSPNVARRGSLFSIDARTNRIVGKPIRLRLPTGIAVADGRLWISNGQHARFGRVIYIDLRTRHILGSIATPGAPESVISARGSVWVGESDSGRVVRINPRTATIVGHPTETNGGLLTLATTRNAIWVADDYQHRLLAIDPANGRIARRRSAPGIFTISAAGANLWALFDRRREVMPLNPRSGLPSATPIRFGQRPDGLVATSTAVWVTTPSSVIRVPAGGSVRIAVHAAKFTYVPGADGRPSTETSRCSAAVARISRATHSVGRTSRTRMAGRTGCPRTRSA
jgi:DNA-binding beta-propeller fold protein YncE